MLDWFKWLLLDPGGFTMTFLLLYICLTAIAMVFFKRLLAITLSVLMTFIIMFVVAWMKYDKMNSSAEVLTWADVIKEQGWYISIDELNYYDENSNKSFYKYYSNLILIPSFILNEVKNDIKIKKERDKVKNLNLIKEQEKKTIEWLNEQNIRKEILKKYE